MLSRPSTGSADFGTVAKEAAAATLRDAAKPPSAADKRLSRVDEIGEKALTSDDGRNDDDKNGLAIIVDGVVTGLWEGGEGRGVEGREVCQRWKASRDSVTLRIRYLRNWC